MGCSEPQNPQRCIIVPPGTEYAVLQEIIALVVSRIHYITPLIVYQIYSNFSIIVFSIQQSCCETALCSETVWGRKGNASSRSRPAGVVMLWPFTYPRGGYTVAVPVPVPVWLVVVSVTVMVILKLPVVA